MTKKLILIGISLIIAFAGARNVMPTRREMNQLEIVRIMGVDKTDNGNIEVTWVRNYSNTEGGGAEPIDEEDGGESEDDDGAEGTEVAAADPGNTISRTGPTVSAAINEIRRAMEREVLASHIEYILIGESAAREDIFKFLDYLSRDSDARLSARVYFVQDGSARELLTQLPPNFALADKLQNVGRNSGASAISTEMTLADFFRKLSSDSGDGLVPNVKLTEAGGQTAAELGGYTVVANRKFAGLMGATAAAGNNLIQQNSPIGYINLRHDESERHISVRISDFNTRINFDFDGWELERIRITTNARGTVSEAQIHAYTYELERIANMLFREQIAEAVELSRRYQSDFLGFGERLRLQHPYRWSRIQPDWREFLATVQIYVVVNTEIEQTHSIARGRS